MHVLYSAAVNNRHSPLEREEKKTTEVSANRNDVQSEGTCQQSLAKISPDWTWKVPPETWSKDVVFYSALLHTNLSAASLLLRAAFQPLWKELKPLQSLVPDLHFVPPLSVFLSCFSHLDQKSVNRNCPYQKVRNNQRNCIFCINTVWTLSAEWQLNMTGEAETEVLMLKNWIAKEAKC